MYKYIYIYIYIHDVWCVVHYVLCRHAIVFEGTGKTMVADLFGIRGTRRR